jgi:hypothetical protein
MAQIMVGVAMASPILHARLRAELVRDPGICIVFDTGNPVLAAESIAEKHPSLVLVDRDMILNPTLGRLMRQHKVLPAVVLVTVYKEGVPVGHVLPSAGTLPFDARPGDIAIRLGSILDRFLKPEPSAPRVAVGVPELRHRFMVALPDVNGTDPVAKQSVAGPAAQPGSKLPSPSKASQLAKTGFLRPMLDAEPVRNATEPARKDTEPALRS